MAVEPSVHVTVAIASVLFNMFAKAGSFRQTLHMHINISKKGSNHSVCFRLNLSSEKNDVWKWCGHSSAEQ